MALTAQISSPPKISEHVSTHCLYLSQRGHFSEERKTLFWWLKQAAHLFQKESTHSWCTYKQAEDFFPVHRFIKILTCFTSAQYVSATAAFKDLYLTVNVVQIFVSSRQIWLPGRLQTITKVKTEQINSHLKCCTTAGNLLFFHPIRFSKQFKFTS